MKELIRKVLKEELNESTFFRRRVDFDLLDKEFYENLNYVTNIFLERYNEGKRFDLSQFKTVVITYLIDNYHGELTNWGLEDFPYDEIKEYLSDYFHDKIKNKYDEVFGEDVNEPLNENKKTKSTNKEFSKYKDSKFNSIRDYTLQDIVDNWESLSDNKNENIKTIKHFINNPDKITDLVYDEKGLEDGYHRLIAAKILKKPRFSYRLVENLNETINKFNREDSEKGEYSDLLESLTTYSLGKENICDVFAMYVEGTYAVLVYYNGNADYYLNEELDKFLTTYVPTNLFSHIINSKCD